MIPGEPLGHIPPRHAATGHKSLRLPTPVDEYPRSPIIGAFWATLFLFLAAIFVLLLAIWVSTFFETEPNIQPCTTDAVGFCIVEP